MKKITIVLLSLMLLLTGCNFGSSNDKEIDLNSEEAVAEQEKFEEFMHEMMVDALSSNKMNAHFAVRDLSPYGLEDMEVSLGNLSDTDYDEIRNEIARLKEIDRSLLLEYQKSLYDRYILCIEEDLYYEGVDDLAFVFAPSSGLNSDLLTMLSEYVIYKEEDIKDFIVYVKDSERLLDEAIAYTQEQVEKGIVQDDTTIAGIIEQCERFVSAGDSNGILVEINRRIDSFDGISSDQKADYKRQIKEAMDSHFIPAYNKVIDYFENLKGTATHSAAYLNFENGKDYYEALVKIKTSSKLSPKDTKNLIQKYIDELLKEVFAREAANPGLFDLPAPDFGMTDANEILEFLESKTPDYFPIPADVTYEVSYLDPSLVTENTAAYYLIPAVDDIKHNVIRVNPNFDGLYTTLAHEGFPGHLYQITYSFSNNHNPILYFLGFIGYTEGWAVYTEDISYEMAGIDSDLALLASANENLSRLVIAICDIMIHYEGATVEDIDKYVTRYGFNESAAEYIYELVLSEPGMFLPYTAGYVKMKNLRAKVEKALGNDFDVVEYHKVILDSDKSTFEYLEAKVDEYIKSKK